MSFRSQIWDGTKWVGMTGESAGTSMFDLLHSRKGVADTPDDEFDSPTLDAKWTVVDGGVGTIDPLLAGSGTTEVYDLTSRPGWMMMQAGTDDVVTLRQDYTLPDGACMVVALEMTMELNAYSNGDNQNIKMALNDSDAGIASGEQITVMIEQDTSGDLWQIQANSDSDAGGNSMPVDIDLFSNLIYFRIMRETLTYTCFFSLDGITWTYLFADTHATAATNVWIGMKGSSALTKAAVGAFAWIRQGTNDLDPWNPVAAVAVQQLANPGTPSYARATIATTDFAITSASTYTAIDWNTESYDTDGYWEGVTNPSRFTAPVDGTYNIGMQVAMDVDTNSDIILGYWLNGADSNESQLRFGRLQDTQDGDEWHGGGNDIIELSAGDYVEYTVYTSAATNRNVRQDRSYGYMQLVESAAPNISGYAKMYKDTDQSISSSTQTELTWTATEFAVPSSCVSLTDNAFVAPVDGVYEITVHAPWEAEDPNDVRLEIQIDDAAESRGRIARSSGYAGGADAYYSSVGGSGMVEMLAGEKATIDIYSDSVALTIRGDGGQEAWATFKRVGEVAPIAANQWGDWIDVDTGVGFLNSWVNYAAGYQVAEYRVHTDGMVHVRGNTKSGTAASMFTLPSGFRPAANQYFPAAADSGADYVLLGSDGNLIAGVAVATILGFNIQFDSTGGS